MLFPEFSISPSGSYSAAVGFPTDADAINKSSTPDFADTYIIILQSTLLFAMNKTQINITEFIRQLEHV